MPRRRLYVVDGSQSAERRGSWKYQIGGQVQSSPAIAYGTVDFGSNDNYLHAFSVREVQDGT
jgi:hypothetical protein